MELQKQQLLISYLVSCQELFIKVSPILQLKYFDPKIKNVIKFVKDYYEDYKASPTHEQIVAETGQTVEFRPTMTRSEIQYAEHELETFCRHKAIEHAILSSPSLLEDEKYGDIEKLIKDAITVGLNRNIGLDYFADPEARLKALSEANNAVPTSWVKLDHYLGGGLNRKEMIIFMAPPGVGKSLTMSNLAKNLLKRRLNGVYITLELSEEVVAKRFDTMFSGIRQTDLFKNITEASIKIKQQQENYGKIFIKRMPESSTNANHIRAYLKEFEIVNGFIPDFMCVDYLDLMCSNQTISAENTFIRDKFISEELRSIANEFNLIMITASQLNRSAQQLESIEDLSQSHVAGGISKINTTDNAVGIYQTATMKARGEMMFKMLKTRSSNGVNHSYMLKFNSSTLELENLEDDIEASGGGGMSRMEKSISGYINRKREIESSETVSKPIGASKLTTSNIPFQV